ncbi:MAG: flagellar biosynthesis protein FlhA [Phycisphaerales bacterium]
MSTAAAKPKFASSRVLPEWLVRLQSHRGLVVPIAFISLLVVLLVPLPPFLLDILICVNISIGVIVLLTTIYMDHPLDFSVFPSLLLALTLLRLVLNVATTRLILTADASTPEEAMTMAGHVISTFASFVAGSSLAVGIIIFLILVVVQFVVITKGATRISEVAARFTLDAMPGKQMAIDADLNAGNIDEAEARRRRERISQEADFFGAMDGASKFVRGDAVAGLFITVINVVGGFAIGILERGWPAAKTAEVFTKLTIGDGLASQLPAFVVSIAAALIVTRSGSKQQLGNELTAQLVSQPMGLFITSGFLSFLLLTPLPKVPLLLLASTSALGGFYLLRQRTRKATAQKSAEAEKNSTKPEPPPPETLLKLDTLELELGYSLVCLVDTAQRGELLEKISAIRRQLAAEVGFILPPVRIRDNAQLQPNEYRVKIKGNMVAQGYTYPAKIMAMDSGIASGSIEGIKTREPAFGLDAWWVEPSLRTRAETLNFTVVDACTVLATHLTEVVRTHADELLTREEVNNLIAQLKEKSPKLVEEVVPTVVKPGELQKVLQNLLRERVSIRDLETILETLADWGTRSKDLDVLTEYARHALRRAICQQHAVTDPDGRQRLVCVTLDPSLEDQINAYIDRSAAGTSFNMPAAVAAKITAQIAKALKTPTSSGKAPVVLASPQVRAVVRQLLAAQLPTVAVLGYNEAVAGVEVESVAFVGLPTEPQAAATR